MCVQYVLLYADHKQSTSQGPTTPMNFVCVYGFIIQPVLGHWIRLARIECHPGIDCLPVLLRSGILRREGLGMFTHFISCCRILSLTVTGALLGSFTRGAQKAPEVFVTDNKCSNF